MISNVFGTRVNAGPNEYFVDKNHLRGPRGDWPPMKFPKGPLPGSFTPQDADAYLANSLANPVLATPSPGWQVQLTYSKMVVKAIPGRSGYHFGEVDFQDQPDKPTDPGIRETSANNAYGNVIPISFGKRRMPGTVIQSSALVPRLIGKRTYSITYQIPIYEDKSDDTVGPEEHHIHVGSGDHRRRPDPDNPPGQCGEDPCSPSGGEFNDPICTPFSEFPCL